MTTKTDMAAVLDLRQNFKPQTRGIITDAEADFVRKTLEIDTRTDLELQNIRNTTVMLYGKWADDGPTCDVMATMDAMSAICAVIDGEKIKRGMEI